MPRCRETYGCIWRQKDMNSARSPLLLLLAPLLVSALMLLAGSLHADESKAVVLGWIEKAIVMPLGTTVKVKLDTGARTSSMDASNIATLRKGGKSWVQFRLHLVDERSGEAFYRDMELPVKRFVRLRGAGGTDRRPVVEMALCFGDTVYREEFTLRDRDNMLYPVLIGRTTLEKLGLVDVRRTFVTQPTCNLDLADTEDRHPG